MAYKVDRSSPWYRLRNVSGTSPSRSPARYRREQERRRAADRRKEELYNSALYKGVARKLGIKNINSRNDIRQIERYLKSGGNLGGSGGSSGGGGSSGNSGVNYSIGSAQGGTEKGIRNALTGQGSQGYNAAQQYQSRANSLEDQIAALRIANQQQIDAITSSFQQQLAESRAAADAQIQSLNDLMLQQRTEFEENYKTLQGQYSAAASAYQNQLNLTQQLSKAFVPEQAPTAQGVSLGDTRSSQQNRNTSSLAALTKLSGYSGAGAGLASISGLFV